MSASTDGYSPPGRKGKRPYNRKPLQNVQGIQAPTSPPQLSNLAFNIHGWALEDGVQFRTTFEVINAYQATMMKGGFEAKIRELERESVTNLYRDDLSYTPRELDQDLVKTDPSVARYLVVGYTLQEDDPMFQSNKTFLRYSDNELVGEAPPSSEYIINWNSILPPILVVTPIKENIGTSVRLFGLIMPRSGLCQPVLLTHERIFYRWEFRASAGARHAQRNKNWNQVVVDKARELTPIDQRVKEEDRKTAPTQAKRSKRQEPTIKQEEEDEAEAAEFSYDLTDQYSFEMMLDLGSLFEPQAYSDVAMTISEKGPELMTRIKLPLNDETRGILKAMRTSSTSRVSQEAKDSLRKAEMTRQGSQLLPEGLSYFVFPNGSFGPREAQMAAAEISQICPQLLAFIDPNTLLRMKRVMDSTGQSIEGVGPVVLKRFFRQVLPRLRFNSNLDDNDVAYCIYEGCNATMKPEQASRVTYTDTDPMSHDTVYLVSLLRELAAIHDWQSRGLGPMFTDVPLPPTFQCMEVEHSLQFDSIDHIRGDMPSHVETLTTFALARQTGVVDILLWLERLRLRIRQV